MQYFGVTLNKLSDASYGMKVITLKWHPPNLATRTKFNQSEWDHGITEFSSGSRTVINQLRAILNVRVRRTTMPSQVKKIKPSSCAKTSSSKIARMICV